MEAPRILTEGGILTGVDPLLDTLSLFYVEVIIIIAVCRGLAILGQHLKQPTVIFEIIGGILLGPSAISRDHYFGVELFKTTSRPFLQLVANIGLVFYLFIVGMELDPQLLVSHGRKAAGIAIAGMAVPFALGIAISRTLFDKLQPEVDESKFTGFYVFIGTSMSITAFPVLARILKEEGLIYTTAGAMVMGSAAINDCIAWCLLILAISLASAGDISVGGYVFLCIVAVAIGLIMVVRPMFHKLVHEVESWQSPNWDKHLFAFTLCLLFLCAWTTALLGVHAIFGGFLFGLVIPRKTKLYHACNEKLEDIVVTMMLPIYFTLSGLNTDITQIRTNEQGAMVVLVCFIATIGKFIGCGGYALFSGLSIRESCIIMVLMNTRGLVELIVLNLGLSFGLLTVETFSVMVLMCLFTTFMTCPIINWIYPVGMRGRSSSAEKKDDDSHEKEEEGLELNMRVHDSHIDFSSKKDLRVTVVVDVLQQMETLMRIIGITSPMFMDSATNITAVKFFEPTNTAIDEFIGLADGRLIKVDAEATSVPFRQPDEIKAHQTIKPILLPLSMFCKTMGCNILSFQVRGDPHEFPRELRTIARNYESDFIIMPWRQGQYVSQLVWASIAAVKVPLALVVQRGQITERFEVALSTENAYAVGEKAARDDDTIDTVENTSVRRGRSNSYARGRSNSLTEEVLRKFSISGDMDAFGYENVKLGGDNHLIKQVLCVVSGCATDKTMLEMAARIIERNCVHVLIVTTADRSSFDQFAVDVFETFHSQYLRSENISFAAMDAKSTDQNAMADEIARYRADLVLISFAAPSTRVDGPPMTDALIVGMPAELLNCGLESPELGIIGSALLAKNVFETVIIFHESKVMANQRAARMLNAANAAIANTMTMQDHVLVPVVNVVASEEKAQAVELVVVGAEAV